MAGFSLEWLLKNFPCQWACPVHTEAGKYVALIAEGRYREAYAVARRPNPLASICGRICAAPCEAVCRRGEIDSPIAIRALKRFVTERFGVESMMDFSVLSEIYGRRPDRYPEPVAVVGSGPAGLACAHDLALLGYSVTIFEAAPVAGGMLRLGVPEYRLPRALIQLEINAILSLGVELRTGVRLGRDLSLADARVEGRGDAGGVARIGRGDAQAARSGGIDRAECRQMANMGHFFGPRLSRSAASHACRDAG